jgi:hypothetical protein
LKGLNLGALDVLGTWVGTPCDPKVTDYFKTTWFFPWGYSKDGASDGSLVGITIGAVVGAEETDNPNNGITIGAPFNMVETEGFTNLTGDSLDDGPTTGPPNPSGKTIGASVDVVETKGFTKRPGTP